MTWTGILNDMNLFTLFSRLPLRCPDSRHILQLFKQLEFKISWSTYVTWRTPFLWFNSSLVDSWLTRRSLFFGYCCSFKHLYIFAMKGFLLIPRSIMKQGMLRLWHLDNLALAMLLLCHTIANLCQIQFGSQMNMILSLICHRFIPILRKRHTITSRER